jgi:Ca-activated chloride channel homolog
MFRFLNPEFLWLLALLPVLAFWLGRQGQAAAVQFPSVETVRRLGVARKTQAGRWLIFFRFLALACAITALARPQSGSGRTEVEASGIDMMLAIDVSGSMEALDFEENGRPVSRLEVVREVVAKFIQDRPNDRIGIVAFAGQPFLVSPLTLDHDWLQQNLERIQTGMGEDGTAIGSGITACVNRLRDKAAKSKVIILLTDGCNNMGRIAPLTAAEAAKAMGVKIYTIGAGSRGPAPIRVKDKYGRMQTVTIDADVDEKTLAQIAEMTGGKFYRATDTSSLGNIYKEIDQLEKTTQKFKRYEHYDELFPWALVPALLLLGFELLLAQTRLRRLP